MSPALLPCLNAATLPLAVEIAAVPDQIRGYGHVKEQSIGKARQRWRELKARLDAAAPSAGAKPTAA